MSFTARLVEKYENIALNFHRLFCLLKTRIDVNIYDGQAFYSTDLKSPFNFVEKNLHLMRVTGY